MGGGVMVVADAAELLAELARQGVELTAEGNSLRYHPRSAVTPELLGELRQHKSELLTLLSEDPRGQTECSRLVTEMFSRVCHAMPTGCVLSEADWKRLDVVHERIDDARRRGDLADLGLAVGCYESLAAELFSATDQLLRAGVPCAPAAAVVAVDLRRSPGLRTTLSSGGDPKRFRGMGT
jgi:hypothetical protein